MAMAHTHGGRPCVTHGLDTRPCVYPCRQLQGYFPSHLLPSQHMYTYLSNNIQHGINELLNVYKHVMLMSIFYANNIIEFTHISTTYLS
ncbi:Protein fat-free [Gossypium arboreum]|uniref:Protein fat-free n=1 Tax=Gossypium arboreum TaxID=29729 RepID=A0A0B0N6Y5_GOSAR|nr:Protein fat-free [Gossypium arboreum]